jgi:LysR family transcriptional regulator, hydrogen peroxide-inducible genes activator
MNLRDLEYLVAVADHRHYGKAALACNVSQPTLSMQLKKLEEQLGVVFFERSHKHVLMTDIGEKIVAQARGLLRTAKEIRETAQYARDPLKGEMKLGVFPTLGPYLLPLCVGAIHTALPSLKLLLVEEKTEILIQKLLRGEIDCALLALPVLDGQLESAALFDDPFLLATPKNHPLARRKRISLEDISGENVLLLEEGHCLRAQALEICSMVGVRENQQFRATSLETLRHMVAAGVGITLIPSIAARPDDNVCYIPFGKPKIARTVGMVWRKKTARTPAIEKINAIISKNILAR